MYDRLMRITHICIGGNFHTMYTLLTYACILIISTWNFCFCVCPALYLRACICSLHSTYIFIVQTSDYLSANNCLQLATALGSQKIDIWNFPRPRVHSNRIVCPDCINESEYGLKLLTLRPQCDDKNADILVSVVMLTE